VYAIENDHAREVPVTTGERIGDVIAVQGVKPGDTLVLAPTEHVKDGARVTLAKK
jgi:HlyD family secretion protein